MSESAPPKTADIHVLPAPKVWRPEMVARHVASQADKFKWLWMIGEDNEGRVVLYRSQMTATGMAHVLRAAVSEVQKTGSQQ